MRGCRLPALKPRKPRKPRHRPFQGNNSRSTCLSHAFLRAFKAAFARFQTSKPSRRPVQGNHFRSYRPQPCGVRDCRLAGRKPLKPLRRPIKPTTLAAHALAMRPRLRFARFETSKPSRRPVQGNHFRSYRPQPSVFLRRSKLPFARFKPRKLRKPRCRPFQEEEILSIGC